MIKSANNSLKEIFIQSVYTHTCTHSSHRHREICNHVLEGKKVVQRSKLQQIVKKNPQGVLIVESFEEDDKKAQCTNFKQSFI